MSDGDRERCQAETGAVSDGDNSVRRRQGAVSDGNGGAVSDGDWGAVSDRDRERCQTGTTVSGGDGERCQTETTVSDGDGERI